MHPPYRSLNNFPAAGFIGVAFYGDEPFFGSAIYKANMSDAALIRKPDPEDIRLSEVDFSLLLQLNMDLRISRLKDNILYNTERIKGDGGVEEAEVGRITLPGFRFYFPMKNSP